MAVEFDAGPKGAFRVLCKTYPGTADYTEGFRTKWGPIFYRGRLDGSARLLVIGQDPAQHEAFARRILMGEAGRRVQGFMAKLGFTKRYVMINAFVYGIFNQKIAGPHVLDAGIVAYRNKWFDAILASGKIQAVVAFGSYADKAWQQYRTTASGKKVTAAYLHILHPTSAGKGTPVITMAKMLDNWNKGLQQLRPKITNPDVTTPYVPYGSDFKKSELPEIPAFDLPPGTPAWMTATSGWAAMAAPPGDQRANITISVPTA